MDRSDSFFALMPSWASWQPLLMIPDASRNHLSGAQSGTLLLQEQQTKRISELTARVEGLEKRLQDASKVWGRSPGLLP